MSLATLGFVGVGRMGGPMTQRLLAAGYGVVVYDKSEAAVAAAVAKGATAAASAKAVADQAEIVLASLPTPEILQAVMLGPDGVVEGAKVKTVIDLSTSGPKAAAIVAAGLAPNDIGWVDSPVSGGVKGAQAGTLAVMVSCRPDTLPAVEPILSNFGKVFFTGEKPGQAQVAKLANNILAAGVMVMTSEVMAMGVKAGLDPTTLLDIIQAGSGRNSAAGDKFPRCVLPGTFDFGFTIGLSYKDVRLCVDEAEAMGVPMVAGAAVRQMLAITNAKFGGNSDFTNIAKVVEEWADVQIPQMAGELIARSVRQALAVRPETLSERVVAKAKLCLADALRCMFEARDLPTSCQALAAVQPVAGATPIAATDRSASASEAAFAMATMSAGLLREDMHAASISHHGIVVWPTPLALSHGTEVDGARVLAAGVVGYEFGARLGAALFDAELARRFRPTAFCATAGAAMAGAYLLGFDETTAVAAVALAVDAASGLNQWPWTGGDEIFFQAGRAAQNAVTATALARAGAFASPSMLDGEAGLFSSLKRPAPADLGLFAGEPAILAVYNKPLPICNFAQTAGQAALSLAAERRFGAGEIVALAAVVTEAARLYPGCDHAGDYERALQAKMSIRFAVAAALAHGDLAEARFHPPYDAETLRLAGLCTLTDDPALTAAFPARQGARVEVRLANGETLNAAREDVAPASEAVVRDGLLASAGETLGPARAKTLLMAIDGLDQTRRAGSLLALTQAGRAHPAAA